MSSAVKTENSDATDDQGISFVSMTRSGRTTVPIVCEDNKVKAKAEVENAVVKEGEVEVEVEEEGWRGGRT